MFQLRGVTLVYGPPGAGKTTFTAWYTYNSYRKVFWVSVFEDEASFRRNMASFGYDFGERLVLWEAPLAGAEAFFSTLLDAVARERSEALVIDSVTEVLAAGRGLDIIYNVLYRAVKQGGVDVFLTGPQSRIRCGQRGRADIRGVPLRGRGEEDTWREASPSPSS